MAETEKSPFNKWWFAAAGFMVLVLLAAVFIGIQIGSSGGDDVQSEASATAPAPEEGQPDQGEGPAPAEGGEDRECGTLSENQDYPTESPPTEWEVYGSTSLTVPVSDDYGPLKRDGELWECYAHSPTGAVYAGVGLLASFTAGEQYEAAIDSPQAEVAYEEEQRASQTSYPAWSAFNIEEYSDSSARISYYGEQGDAAGVFTASVEWDETANDWRLDLTRPVDFDETANADSFVQWER